MTQRWLPLLVLLAFSGLCGRLTAGDKLNVSLVKGQRDAARKAFGLYLNGYRLGTGKDFAAERAFLWSRRWMECEQRLARNKAERLAAAQAHLERMKSLEKMVKQMFRVGTVMAADTAAANYYRLSAEEAVARIGS